MKLVIILISILALFLQVYVVIILYKLKGLLKSISWFFISFGLGFTLFKWCLGLYIIWSVPRISYSVDFYQTLTFLVSLFYFLGFHKLNKDLHKVLRFGRLKMLSSSENKRPKDLSVRMRKED